MNYAFESAPRCGARTKGNQGKPCRCPAIKGKTRCRVHGGKRSGAPQYNQNALKHGNTTREVRNFKQQLRLAIKCSNDLAKKLNT